MIITISGNPGSGKSTVAKILAKKLNLKHHSMGDLQREIAKEKNITIIELGELEKNDKSIDAMLDAKQKKLGMEENNFIIDGRLSFHFIPNSIKIFIEVNTKIGAERILHDSLEGLRPQEKNQSLRETIEKINQRMEIEIQRFHKYYQVNPYDKKNYDFVIDSSQIPAIEVAKKVTEYIKSKSENL